jgi:hypothetical protein
MRSGTELRVYDVYYIQVQQDGTVGPERLLSVDKEEEYEVRVLELSFWIANRQGSGAP